MPVPRKPKEVLRNPKENSQGSPKFLSKSMEPTLEPQIEMNLRNKFAKKKAERYLGK
jgi:hypothetical protein